MTNQPKLAEVIEATTTAFTAQSYELYDLPPLGSLVKTREGETELYGIVFYAATTSLEPGRRPVARGRDEATEEGVYASSPQLLKLLRSEFSALVVGHRANDTVYRYLPPRPARVHAFVYRCVPEETREFSASFDFLSPLLTTHLPVPPEEIVAAALRLFSQAHEDGQAYLVAAGRELASMLGGEYPRLRAILGRLK